MLRQLFNEYIPPESRSELQSASQGGADDAYEKKATEQLTLWRSVSFKRSFFTVLTYDKKLDLWIAGYWPTNLRCDFCRFFKGTFYKKYHAVIVRHTLGNCDGRKKWVSCEISSVQKWPKWQTSLQGRITVPVEKTSNNCVCIGFLKQKILLCCLVMLNCLVNQLLLLLCCLQCESVLLLLVMIMMIMMMMMCVCVYYWQLCWRRLTVKVDWSHSDAARQTESRHQRNYVHLYFY